MMETFSMKKKNTQKLWSLQLKVEMKNTEPFLRESKKKKKKKITQWDRGSTHTESLLHVTFIDKMFWD